MTSNESDTIEGYDCPDCGKTFDTETGKKIHHSRVHKDGSEKKEYECEYCDKTFDDYPSRREGRGRETFYCSDECKNRDQIDSDAITVECAVCGAELRRTSCQQNNMGDYAIKNHFCSKDCESEWKREHWVGDNHPNWHGGSPNYYGENWQKQRRRVRERDNYTCQQCGKTEDDNQYDQVHDVHHIEPFDPEKDMKEQNRLQNLVTLCRSCHRLVEESDSADLWR